MFMIFSTLLQLNYFLLTIYIYIYIYLSIYIYIGSIDVTNSYHKKNIGIINNEFSNYIRHCAKAVLSANKVNGILNYTYSCKSKDYILNLY